MSLPPAPVQDSPADDTIMYLGACPRPESNELHMLVL
jgi:hypothetical protein